MSRQYRASAIREGQNVDILEHIATGQNPNRIPTNKKWMIMFYRVRKIDGTSVVGEYVFKSIAEQAHALGGRLVNHAAITRNINPHFDMVVMGYTQNRRRSGSTAFDFRTFELLGGLTYTVQRVCCRLATSQRNARLQLKLQFRDVFEGGEILTWQWWGYVLTDREGSFLHTENPLLPWERQMFATATLMRALDMMLPANVRISGNMRVYGNDEVVEINEDQFRESLIGMNDDTVSDLPGDESVYSVRSVPSHLRYDPYSPPFDPLILPHHIQLEENNRILLQGLRVRAVGYGDEEQQVFPPMVPSQLFYSSMIGSEMDGAPTTRATEEQVFRLLPFTRGAHNLSDGLNEMRFIDERQDFHTQVVNAPRTLNVMQAHLELAGFGEAAYIVRDNCPLDIDDEEQHIALQQFTSFIRRNPNWLSNPPSPSD